jgi:hypothetical protein
MVSNAANNPALGGLSGATFNNPTGMTIGPDDALYVPDFSNARVLAFAAGATTATRVYGQLGVFTTNGAVASQLGLDNPSFVWVDANLLWITDEAQHRIVRYAISNQMNANLVYGQNSWTGVSPATSQASLSGPNGVAVDIAGNVYVADGANNRIMIWGLVPITVLPIVGAVPTFVNGAAVVAQGTLVTITSNTTINGTLSVTGRLSISPGASVTASSIIVTGTGALNMSDSGALVSLGALTIYGGSTLSIAISSAPVSNVLTVQVAQFVSLSGTFGTTSAMASFPEAQCAQLGTPVLSATSTTLSATIAITPLCAGSSQSGGSLSREAIIGIAVGGGVLVRYDGPLSNVVIEALMLLLFALPVGILPILFGCSYFTALMFCVLACVCLFFFSWQVLACIAILVGICCFRHKEAKRTAQIAKANQLAMLNED